MLGQLIISKDNKIPSMSVVLLYVHINQFPQSILATVISYTAWLAGHGGFFDLKSGSVTYTWVETISIIDKLFVKMNRVAW